MKKHIAKGYTLIEVLVVLAITVIILSLVIHSFNDLAKIQALDKDYLSVASLIDQAKSLSINSKSASQYGVYFASSTAALFKGQSYLPASATNQTYFLNSRVNISGINLVGGEANQVIFERTNGYASASGTVAISLKSDLTRTKTIQIYKTGTIEYK